MEASDSMILADTAMCPGSASIVLDLDEREAVSVGTGKIQALFTEDFLGFQAADVELGQPIAPEAERALRDRVDRGADFTGTRAALRHLREREVGHDRTRRTGLVTVVEVIDVGSVEIDSLLDAAQS